MTATRFMTTACAAAALFITAGAANAVVLPFSEPDFDFLTQGGAPEQNSIWTTGDYWRQTFNATGLTSATDLTLDLNILPYFVAQNLDFDVYVNGNNIGSFILHPADNGFQQYMYSFASIPGADYTIELRATSTIDPGFGSYILTLDGASPSTATLTPTPGALALLAPGALVITRRRRA